jgi:uncharacterized membrane protein
MIAITEAHPKATVGTKMQQPSRQSVEIKVAKVNVGATERAVSVAAGAILAAMGLARRSIPGLLIASVGGALAHRGITGHCYGYDAMGVDTSTGNEIHTAQAFLINKSPEELYSFWRNFQNLPRIMSHLERVDVLDETLSHWVAKSPAVAGSTIEWDAEITADEPNNRIAWRSVPGSSSIDHYGEIVFTSAMGDRGTEVHVRLAYNPPAGHVGNWIAWLSGESVERQIRDDLRNFKRLMECGEIPTINGQARGTCTGVGRRDS